jgi:hypothetical protein
MKLIFGIIIDTFAGKFSAREKIRAEGQKE